MDKFGFVVLHYLAPEMTRRCVISLSESFPGMSIVVVDNASPDGSGEALKKEFASIGNVTVILNESNLGFARGNNAGYDYLKRRGECRFTVVMNNDVVIDDPGFASKVESIYSETAFAVLGPDILNPLTGSHQNPAHLKAFTVQELESLRDKYSGYLRNFWWRRLKWNIKKAIFPAVAKDAAHASTHITERKEGVVLHGACYIFSDRFTSAREYCFNPSTFMYFEEDILHFECVRDGLKMVYDPSVRVLHYEDVSTNKAFGKGNRKDRFKFEHMGKSIDVLTGLMK